MKSSAVVFIVAALCAMGFLCEVSAEVVYYVDDDSINDPGPGDPCVSDPLEDGSTAHPFDSIQEAIDAAVFDPCDSVIVIVRDGWYSGMGNYNIDPRGLNIEIKSQNSQPWATIIDCNGMGRGFIIRGDSDANTVIDGFLIFNGNASEIQFPDTSRKLGGAIYCQSDGPVVIRNCVMYGNYAEHSGGAVYLYECNDVTLYRCEITFNMSEVAGGGIYAYRSKAVIQNCVVAANYGYWSGGISSNFESDTTIVNCTVADNYAEDGPDGLECVWDGYADVKNSIFWTDTRWWQHQQQVEANEPLVRLHIFLEAGGDLTISYSDVEGGWEGVYVEDANCEQDWGIGNINADPLFARYFFTDYHLKSTVGRWTPIALSNGDYNNNGIVNFSDFAVFAYYWSKDDVPDYVNLDGVGLLSLDDLGIFCSNWLKAGENFEGWVQDDVNSPCLDAGDPCSVYALEPEPNGGRINMGAYGNTEQASMSCDVAEPRRWPDMDGDDDVDFVDFALFAKFWLVSGSDIDADFDYSGFVNYVDLIEFCRWWLWGK